MAVKRVATPEALAGEVGGRSVDQYVPQLSLSRVFLFVQQ